MTDALEVIRGVVGDAGLIAGDAVRERPGDWAGRKPCGAKAIVRPRDTAQLAEVMKLCSATRQAVVPAGGLTGLAHGADAGDSEVMISFERMRAIEALDPVAMTMTVQAGVLLQAIHEAAAEHGLMYAVDLGARGSCTIGGNIATNAGGNSVIRYGMTRENVLGVEAVLADGTIVSSMNAMLKNNAAFDLKQLFIGSEGTLGLVTRAVLRLRPATTSEVTAIVAITDFESLKRVFGLASKRLGSLLSSFEVMWREFYELVAIDSGKFQPPLPGGHGFYAIVEATGADGERDAALVERVLAECLEQGLVEDAVVAGSKAQRNAIWAIREESEVLIKAMAPGVMFDVSLPLPRMQEFVAGMRTALAAEWGENVRSLVYGHIGDSNLHLIVSPRPWSEEAKQRVEEIVYTPLADFNGSMSAEHGVGTEKRAWLHVSRTPEEIALMKQLKALLDPLGILNPGKVL